MQQRNDDQQSVIEKTWTFKFQTSYKSFNSVKLQISSSDAQMNEKNYKKMPGVSKKNSR